MSAVVTSSDVLFLFSMHYLSLGRTFFNSVVSILVGMFQGVVRGGVALFWARWG